MPDTALTRFDPVVVALLAQHVPPEQACLLRVLAASPGHGGCVAEEDDTSAAGLVHAGLVCPLTLYDGDVLHQVTPLGMQVSAALAQTEGPGALPDGLPIEELEVLLDAAARVTSRYPALFIPPDLFSREMALSLLGRGCLQAANEGPCAYRITPSGMRVVAAWLIRVAESA